ncbi:MAG TPA: glycosyltransferase [Planctomycetaceae bacterium]|nr:glycosyltransferase [Planctomycetaceae bacterium]
MIDLGKKNLLGVNVSAVDYEAAVAKIIDAAENRYALGVSALAVHGVMTGAMDDMHRHRLNELELIVPDGQPVRWALNLLHGTALPDRVYGPNLMLKTCAEAAQKGLGIFLFGGKQALLDDLQSKLFEKFPNLKISGTMPSRFRKITPDEKLEIIQAIKTSGAAITMVGLGCPRQEVWAYEFKDDLRMPVLAVGAAFNFHAGQLPQAPIWMQRFGLEWFYRFTKEPTRLWQRYLVLNPYYLTLVFLQWSKLRKFDPTSTTPPDHEILYG